MLSWSLVKKSSHCLPLLKLVICYVTYWRKDDKILQLLSEIPTLSPTLFRWLTATIAQPARRLAVIILYGVMKRVLQHQQFMIEPCFFELNLIQWFLCHTQSCHCIPPKTCHFRVMVILFLLSIIFPDTQQNTPFILILVCSAEETRMCCCFGDIVIPFAGFLKW